MAHNLFDNAKFADIFLTTENKQAVFLRLSENAENKFAVLYVKDWGTVQVFRHNGNEVNGDIAHSIIRKQEEPVGEDLDDAAFDYAEACKYEGGDKLLCIEHFKAGAQWKEEQVKKNLIAYCDNLTKEQVQVNYDFVADRLKKSSRTPSYIDAIEYGKNIVLAELEKIVKDKEEAGKNYVFAFSEVKDLVKKMSQKG